ncbi:MAG: sodium:proton antiporter [Actinobacteria bacterium]|nr:sodium:proton antiporter [Actinomycetota bacterium]
MTARVVLFGAAVAALTVLMVAAFGALADPGLSHDLVGQRLAELAVEERHTANTVTAVLYDLRALDTLGEELVLFAAVTGTALLLRVRRDEDEETPPFESRGAGTLRGGDAVRTLGVPLIGVTAIVGAGLLVNGHLTPGGGFQGGVVLAGSLLLLYLLHDYDTFDRIAPVDRLERLEGLAIGAFALSGLGGLVLDRGYLGNVLPVGELGELLSGGTIALLNITTGVAVTAGIGVLLAEFVGQALRVGGE